MQNKTNKTEYLPTHRKNYPLSAYIDVSTDVYTEKGGRNLGVDIDLVLMPAQCRRLLILFVFFPSNCAVFGVVLVLEVIKRLVPLRPTVLDFADFVW